MDKLFNNEVCVSSPTWGELLKFIQEKINPKFYDKPCGILINDGTDFISMTSVEVVEENIYVYDNSDDRGTVKDLGSLYGDEFDIRKCILITEKGHPFLYYDEEPLAYY